MSKKTPEQQLEEIKNIQTSKGNWDCDPYMHGMANGLILADAIVKDIEPVFLEAPKEWIDTKI